MTIFMGLDPAAGFGWAVYDSSKPYSAIESDSLTLPKGKEVKPYDKLFHLRAGLVPLIRRHKPVFVGIEGPFMFVPRYAKKPAVDMLTGAVEDGAEGEEGSMNPKTLSMAGQIAGAATALCLAFNIPCAQFQPRSWQAGIIPRSVYQQFPGKENAKKRAKVTCDLLKIVSPNIDSRDAALIAIYAAGCQEFKMLQQRQRAA